MLKKKIIIVLSIIVILANFLPLNICYASNIIPTSTSEPDPSSTPANTAASNNSIDDLFYDGLGNR